MLVDGKKQGAEINMKNADAQASQTFRFDLGMALVCVCFLNSPGDSSVHPELRTVYVIIILYIGLFLYGWISMF